MLQYVDKFLDGDGAVLMRSGFGASSKSLVRGLEFRVGVSCCLRVLLVRMVGTPHVSPPPHHSKGQPSPIHL
jgi:hypothetical protein